jgi:hypothetical protein
MKDTITASSAASAVRPLAPRLNDGLVLTYAEFAARYCELQEQTPDGLKAILQGQRDKYKPEGWFMLECQMLDSSRIGQLTILPYGPNNTFKTVPTHPVSPRGLASDMSTVCAVLPANGLD